MSPKKIIIVGASSGIGREMAIQYASQGNTVGVTGRREELLIELKQKYPEQIITSCFDLRQRENQQKIQQLIEELGGVDLVIYNAGFGEPSKELSWPIEEATTKTNVNGFVEIICYVFNYFMAQGYGQIAIISSVAAVRGNGWAPAYSASKSFMSVYGEGLNIKAKRSGKNIAITDIRPGFIDTKMAQGNRRFWMISKEDAALKIIKAVERKKRVAYITRQWWFIAQMMRLLPFSIYRRIV